MNYVKRGLIAVALVTSVYSNSAFSWWTNPNNTHYQMTILSHQRLSNLGLLHYGYLKEGANNPDRVSGVTKLATHHRHFYHLEKNYNEAIRKYRNRDYQGSALNLASSFHYVQDALDFSHDFDSQDVLREIIKNFDQLMKEEPSIRSMYRDVYSGELNYLNSFNLNQVVRNAQKSQKTYRREMQRAIDTYEEEEAAKVAVRNLAVTVAHQDRILDIFASRVQ
ncbi:MAG: hypothetical protein JKX81_00185 [Arenicella sp.]|nr:hypothetical protein [Arenicella sp.]